MKDHFNNSFHNLIVCNFILFSLGHTFHVSSSPSALCYCRFLLENNKVLFKNICMRTIFERRYAFLIINEHLLFQKPHWLHLHKKAFMLIEFGKIKTIIIGVLKTEIYKFYFQMEFSTIDGKLWLNLWKKTLLFNRTHVA